MGKYTNKDGQVMVPTTIYIEEGLLGLAQYYAKVFKKASFSVMMEDLLRKEMTPKKKQIEDSLKTASDVL